MEVDWRQQLAEGLGRLDVRLPEARVALLTRYLVLLEKWNRVFNLTAVRDRTQLVERHLVDSLAVLPHVEGARLLDVGSGAGLPGIPLAVARPDLYVELLDSSSKKTRFLTQVRLELDLSNVHVVHARVEDYVPDRPFDTVISRAFASVGDYWRLARHLLAPGGVMLAMKARAPNAELAEGLAGEDVIYGIVALPPLRGAARHLVVLRRAHA